MSLYVAAYDISETWRRNRVGRVLMDFGRRVQWSVFLLQLDPDELPELRRRVGSLLSIEDHFDLVPIDDRGSRHRWSWQRPPDQFEPVLLW